MTKKSTEYDQLKAAMDAIRDLKIPDHLQQQAFEHLLKGASTPKEGAHADSHHYSEAGRSASSIGGLRGFVASLTQKGSVAEIPALLYWARNNEEKDKVNERNVIELYRRAGIRPPKRVDQAMRDLSSKRYFRLESVKGERGYFKLSRTGEDFVIHELIPADNK